MITRLYRVTGIPPIKFCKISILLPIESRGDITISVMDELIPTRTTLLERLKNPADDSSWRIFYETYRRLIHGVAVKSGLMQDEAQEVVQETMIAVARYIPTFKYDRNVGSFKHWLLNMARWRIADQFRKREPVETPNRSSKDETATGTGWMEKVADPTTVDLEAFWESQWEKNLFDAAVAKVKRSADSEKYQIFDCCVYKEWAPEKVARAFGISVDRVYMAKHRIMEMIKGEVERLKREII
jgi:RNA polymerase sigma factor (sigma-70 family)